MIEMLRIELIELWKVFFIWNIISNKWHKYKYPFFILVGDLNHSGWHHDSIDYELSTKGISQSRNPCWKERLSTVDLLIKTGYFVKKKNAYAWKVWNLD